MRKYVHIGRALLWTAALLSLYLLFWGSKYRLSPSDLPRPQADAIRGVAPRLFSKSFDTHIEFLSSVQKAFVRYEEASLSKCSFDTAEQKAFVEQLPKTFTFSAQYIDNYQHSDPRLSALHKAALKKYGNWLIGRTYEHRAAFAKDLSLVAEDIHKSSMRPSEIVFGNTWEKTILQTEWLRLATHSQLLSSTTASSLIFSLLLIGTLMYLLPRYQLEGTAGIKHNGTYFHAAKSRGWLGWLIASLLLLFYVVLYFFPAYVMPWVVWMDPLSEWIKGRPAGRFFLYGLLYTLVVVLMGVRMFIKYRHSIYHKLRTSSLIFFQLCIAFLLPEFLLRLNKPSFDFKNIWPLDYDFFFETELHKLVESGALGLFMLGWGMALIVIAVPVLTYFFGKRWYCSWVCGCGALAETLGDPYRQLSDKSLLAWKIERWSVHLVLVFAVGMTAAVLYTYWSGEQRLLGLDTFSVQQTYGFFIGALFSGVVGTGFYPIMGSRVWCRFGCPLAAYLGLVQRFRSRFRITTNGGQCISCGNCSTYCEMGIDVRHYAQRGQPVVRSSCVGCGVCASVCPRGVLRLENTKEGRFEAKLIGLEEPQLSASSIESQKK